MQNTGLMMGTFKYLRAPVLANVHAGMKVQVLTDTAHDPRVWQVVMSALTEIGADAVLSLFDPRPADYYDPPQAVCEAMMPYKIQRIDRNKEFPLLMCLYPGGELNVPPVEGSANGKLVVDLCMHQLGRLSSPIELTIENGRIRKIEGGADAYTLRTYLARYGDENALMCPAEASVGINSKALIRGVQREDKNILGTMHFGLGTNVDVGGSILSNIHMDGVILQPTLYVDDEMRIQDGRFLRQVEGAD
jgi:hypothetical protein